MSDRSSRRRVLVALGALLGGCSAPGDGGNAPGTEAPANSPSPADRGSTPSPSAGESTASSTPGGTATATTTGELDLREANVVGVEVAEADGGYRFDVTLHHDDDGEDGYANWWQVESLDGERLGRRDLLHAHGTREFTRSYTIEVPDGTTCVVVRGHDQTHGYGGRAALVALPGGDVRLVDQGPEPDSFDASDCP